MKRVTISWLTGLLLAMGSLTVQAEEVQPLAFRSVMQALGNNMSLIAGAIAREDWATVERTAPEIAMHPSWTEEEHQRIMRFLGRNAERFHHRDHAVHEAAHAMQQAAAARNPKAVIDAFHDVQRGCQACHSDFRKPFMEHFDGMR